MKQLLSQSIHLAAMMMALVVATPAFAANDFKVGVVNVREIVQKSPQAEKVNAQLEKEFQIRKNELISADKALKEKMDKFTRDRDILSEAEKSKTQKDIISQQRELQRMEAELREDTVARQREEMEKILQKVSAIINEIAEADKYTLILHRDAAPFVSNSINITTKVLARMEKASS